MTVKLSLGYRFGRVRRSTAATLLLSLLLAAAGAAITSSVVYAAESELVVPTQFPTIVAQQPPDRHRNPRWTGRGVPRLDRRQ